MAPPVATRKAPTSSDRGEPGGANSRRPNGRTVTGFTNIEEDFVDEAAWSAGALPRGTHVMPWRIEDEMKKLGANYIQAGLWRGFAIRDGNLITGQQNYSGAETADVIVRALGE